MPDGLQLDLGQGAANAAPTLKQMIAAVEREIGMRRRVYPGWIASKRMTKEKADAEIATMEGVLGVLRKVGTWRDLIRECGVPPGMTPEETALFEAARG